MKAETNLEISYKPPKYTSASTRKYMMTIWRLASSYPSWPKDKQKPGLINLLKRPKPNTTDPTFDLGTYEEFQETLRATFSAYNSPGNALNKMKNLRIKYDDNIDKHITMFATLLSESCLDKKSAVIVNIFREMLPVKLQSKIMNLETPPTDLHGWYKWVKNIDNTTKQTHIILGKTQQNLKTNKMGTGPCYFSHNGNMIQMPWT